MDGKDEPTRARGPAGRAVRATGKDGPQVVATTGKRWSDAAERLFLDTLAGTCNVRLSAAECGFSPEALYARRRRDPAFATLWEVALDIGYHRIEAALVRASADALEGRAPDPETPIRPMTVGDALAVLRFHAERTREKRTSAKRWAPRTRSLDEVRDSILAKLEAIEAKRVRG